MVEYLCRDSFRLEGGSVLESMNSFLVSVLAGIVVHYICKWLDR